MFLCMVQDFAGRDDNAYRMWSAPALPQACKECSRKAKTRKHL